MWFDIDNPELYEGLNIHFINNENYEVVSIGGLEFYSNDMRSCHKKMDEVIKDLEESFPNAERTEIEINDHTSDPTGKSKTRDMWFVLNNGQIYIDCTDWSQDITDKYGWTDGLGVYLENEEFIEWLKNDA